MVGPCSARGLKGCGHPDYADYPARNPSRRCRSTAQAWLARIALAVAGKAWCCAWMGRRGLVRDRTPASSRQKSLKTKGEARGGLKENSRENSRDNPGRTKAAGQFHRPEPAGLREDLRLINTSACPLSKLNVLVQVLVRKSAMSPAALHLSPG